MRDHLGNRLDLAFEDIGEQALKNIERPVRVFRVAFGLLRIGARRDAGAAPSGRKPSIAVLPFNNMSGDPEQEYFSDGITGDIITDLSKVSGFCDRAQLRLHLQRQAGRRAGGQPPVPVSTVLEGSVRKAGQRVRITAQLVNGKDGGHLWAERYDRDLTDIFAMQDEITTTIVDQLKVKLLPGEKEAISKLPTENIEAYTYYLRGRQFSHLHSTPHARLAQAAVPQGGRARSGAMRAPMRAWPTAPGSCSPTTSEDATVDEILAASTTALELDPTLAEALRLAWPWRCT